MTSDGTDAIADFDSAWALARTLAAFLHGEAAEAAGLSRLPAPPPAAAAATLLPATLRRQIHAFGGWLEAVPARRAAQLDAEAVARRFTDLYPAETYPAVAIGAANGALIHLFAAMGIPWLPQTWLLPLRGAAGPVDDARAALRAARPVAEAILARNPGLAVHHQHDPVQDRLMLRHMSVLRLKRLRLGHAYDAFLRRALAPGGTIYVVDCRQRWPVTRLAARHVFQVGAVGGLPAAAYHEDRAAYEAFVRTHGCDPAAISLPAPTEEAVEAEWGFHQAITEDIEALAEERGYDVRDLIIDTPDAASAPVADLHRLWYRRIGRPDTRLLAETAALVDPHQALIQAFIPYWLAASRPAAVDALAAYARRRGPFHTILALPFPHGLGNGSTPSLDAWRAVVERAEGRGRLIGVDAEAWPPDLGLASLALQELAAEPGERLPLPGPLSPADAEALIEAVAMAGFRLV